jgi:hypothetical protein
MQGVEFELWEALEHVAPMLGSMRLDPEATLRLRALSEACDGWIYFDAEAEETFVSTQDWLILRGRYRAERCV